MDTPPHSNSRNVAALNSSNEANQNSNFVNGGQQEGMHVFVNSQTGGHAVNGGKFVAASQQYLQVSCVDYLELLLVSSVLDFVTV